MRGQSELRLIGRLLSHSLRQRPSIIPITLLGLVSSLAEVAAMVSIVPVSILAAGGALAPHSLWRRLPEAAGIAPDARFFVILFLSLLLFRMVSNIAVAMLLSHTMQSLFSHFAVRAFAAFIRHLAFRDIIRQQIGHFFSIAGDESNRGAQIVTGVMRIIPIIALFAVYVALIFYQSWPGGLAFFALGGFMIVALRGTFRRGLKLGALQSEQSRMTNTHFYDALGGLRTVRGFTAEGFVIRRYESLMKQYSRTSFLAEAFTQLTQTPIMLVLAAVLMFIAVYANNAILIQNMPVFFAGVLMFTRLMPIAGLGLETAMRLTSNLRAGRHVDEMLRAVEDAEAEESLPAHPAQERITRIEFSNLTFRYTEDTPFILEDFSCVLEAGRSYAITGPSGAGKSSLVDLLLKFYEPQRGAIRVNGRDIAHYSALSLREHVILAEQAIRLFHGTVLENVQFDDETAKARAVSALQMVGLGDSLKSLGPESLLTFGGGNVSGGQRQRIGIARALVRTADVLILDESTNALDADTREIIMTALLAHYKDRILIFVTHDSHVLKRVDEVIRMRPLAGLLDEDEMSAAQ